MNVETAAQRSSGICQLSHSDWIWHGCGYSTAHFGEILQGEFSIIDGCPIRGLVTLPYRKGGVICHAYIRLGSGEIDMPHGKKKTLAAVRKYLIHYSMNADVDVDIHMESSVPEGIGMGSSTADIVATIRALDSAFGYNTTPEDIAAMAVFAEQASDSIMISNNATLFAQRTGKIIESFGRPLPPMTALGTDTSPGSIFSTVENIPATYTAKHIGKFDDLKHRLREAISASDARAVAQVATESSLLNQEFFPKENLHRFMDISASFGAVGVAIAHSGTVACALFESRNALSPCVIAGFCRELELLGYGQPELFKI